MTKPIAFLSLASGLFFGLIGIGLISAYFLEAVIARWGDPDQSLLFWYLPFLFFGVIIFGAGIGLGTSGYHSLKRQPKSKNGPPA